MSDSPCRCPTRREVLGASAAFGAVLAFPRWLLAGEGARERPRRTLVLLHLGGGNDGLNTVIPYRDRAYARLRPTLGVEPTRVIRLSDGAGLHPSLAGLETLWKKDLLAVVQGVGYPQPDYSHFRSTEIWYTAKPDGDSRDGWVGRALEARASSAPLRAAALSKEPPLSLVGSRSTAVATVTDFARFRLPPGIEDAARAYADRAAAPGALGEVGRAGARALEVAKRIADLRPADLPLDGPLGEGLKRVIALLEADLGLEAIHLTFDGFDTHANQANGHAQLLRALGDGLSRFQERLARHGADERTVVLVFSEFGRRPEENASGGTDHGSAGPCFVIGKGVRPGLHGAAPSLEDLDDGNFRHTTDFRRVYAALLRDGLGVDPAPVLGAHEPLDLFS